MRIPFEDLLTGAGALTVLAVAALFVVLALVVRYVLRRPRRRTAETAPAEPFQAGQLQDVGPAAGQPFVRLHNLPFRIAAIVWAPLGRGSNLPDEARLQHLLDEIVPGLRDAAAAHDPVWVPWPVQLSAGGFVTSFFNAAALPGDRGKKTPWCALAGRVDDGDGKLALGLVLRGDRNNGLSCIPLQHEHQWAELLSVGGVDVD